MVSLVVKALEVADMCKEFGSDSSNPCAACEAMDGSYLKPGQDLTNAVRCCHCITDVTSQCSITLQPLVWIHQLYLSPMTCQVGLLFVKDTRCIHSLLDLVVEAATSVGARGVLLVSAFDVASTEYAAVSIDAPIPLFTIPKDDGLSFQSKLHESGGSSHTAFFGLHSLCWLGLVCRCQCCG